LVVFEGIEYMDPTVCIVALVSIVAVVALSKRVRIQARGLRFETEVEAEAVNGQNRKDEESRKDS
jgi:hypothetical protein